VEDLDLMRDTSLLLAAIEDNIAWCSTVCAAHGSDERISANTWSNLAPSPPYYPNIITRRPQARSDVIGLVAAIRKRPSMRAWGIKDSFDDLDLTTMGFDLAIEGQWFAGKPAAGGRRHDWEAVRGPEELSLWEQAWNQEAQGRRIFKDTLLADPRIRFWMQRRSKEIIAGCISFVSGPVIGLSNWFCKQAETVFDLGIRHAVAETATGRPVVCWTSSTEAAPPGLTPLGPLRVWISAPG
jgi:hypothetical protein